MGWASVGWEMGATDVRTYLQTISQLLSFFTSGLDRARSYSPAFFPPPRPLQGRREDPSNVPATEHPDQDPRSLRGF